VKPHAIPTKYAGTQFRSRLEARWAAFFDLLAWEWHYEPFDYSGWIPDFFIGPAQPGFLVECKPSANPTNSNAIRKAQTKAKEVPGRILIVGSIPRLDPETRAFTVGSYRTETAAAWEPAAITTHQPKPPPDRSLLRGPGPAQTWHFNLEGAWYPQTEAEAGEVLTRWRQAGNRVQWRGPGRAGR
jgi:hypothetical protein